MNSLFQIFVYIYLAHQRKENKGLIYILNRYYNKIQSHNGGNEVRSLFFKNQDKSTSFFFNLKFKDLLMIFIDISKFNCLFLKNYTSSNKTKGVDYF